MPLILMSSSRRSGRRSVTRIALSCPNISRRATVASKIWLHRRAGPSPTYPGICSSSATPVSSPAGGTNNRVYHRLGPVRYGRTGFSNDNPFYRVAPCLGRMGTKTEEPRAGLRGPEIRRRDSGYSAATRPDVLDARCSVLKQAIDDLRDLKKLYLR